MKIIARAAIREAPEDAEKNEPQNDPVELSVEQIEARASTKTAVLEAILAQETRRSDVRHWGINE